MPPTRRLLFLGFLSTLTLPIASLAQETAPGLPQSKVRPVAVEAREAASVRAASPPQATPTQPSTGGQVDPLFPNAPVRAPQQPRIAPAPGGAAPADAPLPPAPSGTPAERERWLAGKLDEILARPSLAGVRIGVMVAEIDSGRTLYARDERLLYNPASNAKLFTTAAALGLLGPEFRFRTSLVAASVKNGEVQGDLYLRGSGDPSLVSEDLWRLVADLAGAGVKRVSGGISIDDTYFDDVRVGPAFEQKNEDFAFRAPAGAVSLNYNACAVHVMPGPRDGVAPRVVVEPASPYFIVVNNAKTVSRGKSDISITTRAVEGHTEVTVGGTIKKGGSEVIQHRRVAHPDLYAGYSLRELLLRRGIKIGREEVRHANAPAGRTLAVHLSPPLGVIVREVNKLSNNFMAEQLLKTLGAEVIGKPGSWPKGVQAVARFLDALGIPASSYRMTNGSGLYDADRFTPEQVVTLLRYAYRDFRWAADFVGSLALSGADGTIGHRMEGSAAERYVRAKTGTLAGVSCLSGYAGAPGHLPLAFAILMNGVADAATGEARKAQDAMADVLVTFLGVR